MGAAAGRRLSRLALAALATLVVITATASACENEELNRLVEEAPPPGATVAVAQQGTSGTLAPPQTATILYKYHEVLSLEDRVSSVMEHASSVGWTFVDREQFTEESAVTLRFMQGDYEVSYRINHKAVLIRPNCVPQTEMLYGQSCFDSISIRKR